MKNEGEGMSYRFEMDPRLGIELPTLDQEWSDIHEDLQAEILEYWERIRGRIPDRIKQLEKIITVKQTELNRETEFAVCCRLNTEIAELASIITDLHLWYRSNQEVSSRIHT
jgi:hypothetical protein